MSQIDFDAIDKDLLPEIEQRNKILDALNLDIVRLEEKITKLNPAFLFIYTFDIKNVYSDIFEEYALVWMFDRNQRRKSVMYAIFKYGSEVKPENNYFDYLVYARALNQTPWYDRMKLKDYLADFYTNFIAAYKDNINNLSVNHVIYVNGSGENEK